MIQILDYLLSFTDAQEFGFPLIFFLFLLRPGKLYLTSVFNFDNSSLSGLYIEYM